MPQKVVLASTSRYRAAQLRAFGLAFTARPPKVDEAALKKRLRLSPRALSRRLALEKAKSLRPNATSAAFEKIVIIGADQLLNFRGRVLGKPKTQTNNLKMLLQLQNKTHELITSVALVHGRRAIVKTVTAKIELRKLSRREITEYVRRDRALDCAGGYKFEKSGFGLVEKMSVSDPSSLIGLGLITLGELFLALKIPIPYRR